MHLPDFGQIPNLPRQNLTCPLSYLMQGEATYLFSLVYTSLEDILGRIQELWTISRKDDTKVGRLEAKKLLAVIIQVRTDQSGGREFGGGGWGIQPA